MAEGPLRWSMTSKLRYARLGLTMTAALLLSAAAMPPAAAVPNVPYLTCPGPSGPWGGWVYQGYNVFYCPGSGVYCYGESSNCWTRIGPVTASTALVAKALDGTALPHPASLVPKSPIG